jgi:hypothetical protein
MFPMHLPLLLLFFPNGRLPSARWRWLPRVVVPCGLSASALAVKIPGELGVADLANPYAAAGAAGTVVQVIVFTAVIVMFLCVVAATVSMVVHRRRSSGQERLQLRWFTWAAGMLAAVLVFTGAGALISNEVVNSLLFSVAMAGLFTAIGVAVLRYRLYEIDRIISRTVTYATVTVVVVAVYLGGVTVITTVTSPVAGDSPLSVAAATLAAAAVFGPARRRIQGSVDRRFNRARYDAERIVEGYRAHLRDEIDLRSLEAELRATVQATVQPTTTGLWLRSPGGQA